MPDFTKGIWKYEEYGPNGVTINGKEYIIYTGSVNSKEPGEDIALAKREADARLIIVAPEMYELLEECADELGAIGLPTLSRECYELLARIDGKEASYD